MLNWANRFNIFCYLDNCQYSFQPHHYECLLATGKINSISSEQQDFNELDDFITVHKKWIFGHLSYDLKSQLHGLSTTKRDYIHFPYFFFFIPQVVCLIKGNELMIQADQPEVVYQQILQQEQDYIAFSGPIEIKQRLSKEYYIQCIQQLQRHILRGDCYEVNFCQEFFAENTDIHPLTVFKNLIGVSPNPFSAFYRFHDLYLVCASPERFITKMGNQIISQPMKGTARRNLENSEMDNDIKNSLFQSSKERAENVMVVDLVRNDLSIICREASVTVQELFGIYTFPQVHQMVSTITGDLKEKVVFTDIIKAAFPMGSMTGAPKLNVMKLIDTYEPSARGIFSGSVGYISPEGDFDFNVVIRSIMYNAFNRYLSYQVGSGITFYSEPEKEWEECLLKGEAIKKVLT